MIIQKLNSAPTDAEYIQAFRENDNGLINQFRHINREKFKFFLKKDFGNLPDETITRIYQETTVRLWENIQKDIINEQKLTCTLFGYMMGIGDLVTHEFSRENKHIILSSKIGNDYCPEEEFSDEVTNESFKTPIVTGKQVCDDAAWYDMVENPFLKFRNSSHTDEECADELVRLTELYDKSQRQKKKEFYTEIKPEEKTILQVIIKNVVENMGNPCKPLLKLFYWEKMSMETIANELHYSGADSAKTQKNKCMGKLTVIITNLQKSYLP